MSIQSYGNARAEIDAFAHGIHPRALTDGGLAADPSRGSGLRGLTDRFDALGGWLSIESRRGVGTRLLATLPVEVDDVASPLPTSHVLVDCRPPHHASSVTGA